MALIRVSFMSAALHRTVPLVVVLPTDKVYFDGKSDRPANKPYKTLYLLNGMLGNETDWVAGTRIQRWAEDRNLAVVMPAGENAFYIDHEWSGDLYSQFIGQELVEFTRKTFPLSHDRADTYIGGLSMGGYGALYNGLKFHDTFSAIVALSAALKITSGLTDFPENPKWFAETRAYWTSVFGPELDHLDASKYDPEALIKQLLARQIPLPNFYIAVGQDDDLLSANQDFDAFLTANQIDHVFEVDPGAHEWDFWDLHIKRALDWLPLEKQDAGASSGNVKADN